MTELLRAAPASLGFGVGVATLAVTLGWLLGSIAGFWGGRVAGLTHAVADTLLGLPRVVLILCLVSTNRALFGDNLVALGLVLGASGWMGLARVVEAQAREVATRGYVEAALGLGLSRPWVLVRHVLPHTWAPVLAQLPLGVAAALNLQAGLAAIGALSDSGATWGGQLQSNADKIATGQLDALAPLLPLVVVSVLAQLLSDRLRAHLEPDAEVG